MFCGENKAWSHIVQEKLTSFWRRPKRDLTEGPGEGRRGGRRRRQEGSPNQSPSCLLLWHRSGYRNEKQKRMQHAFGGRQRAGMARRGSLSTQPRDSFYRELSYQVQSLNLKEEVKAMDIAQSCLVWHPEGSILGEVLPIGPALHSSSRLSSGGRILFGAPCKAITHLCPEALGTREESPKQTEYRYQSNLWFKKREWGWGWWWWWCDDEKLTG